MAQGRCDYSPKLAPSQSSRQGNGKCKGPGAETSIFGKTGATGQMSKERAMREPGAKSRWASEALVTILYKRLQKAVEGL